MARSKAVSRRPQQGSKGQAFAELFFEIAAYFFRMRAAGQRLGFVSKRGGGTLGFMRTLALDGPMTVPDLARMRPTSRQRMQQLADELAAEGLVAFVANPRHRKSKLMRLTRKGEARFRDMLLRFRALAGNYAKGLSEAELREATRVVRTLRELVPVA
jgi:DNA-binding MarR family transcriptional regulator